MQLVNNDIHTCALQVHVHLCAATNLLCVSNAIYLFTYLFIFNAVIVDLYTLPYLLALLVNALIDTNEFSIKSKKN